MGPCDWCNYMGSTKFHHPAGVDLCDDCTDIADEELGTDDNYFKECENDHR